MVRFTPKRSAGGKPHPIDMGLAEGQPRVPTPIHSRYKARSRGRLPRSGPIALFAAASFCVLVTHVLGLPGLVLGADRAPAGQDDLISAVGHPSEPAAGGRTATPAVSAAPPTVVYTTAADSIERAGGASDLPTSGGLIVTLPWGSGPGDVGLAKTAEGLTRGPEALAIAPDERIAVLDSVNGRLLLLGPSGKVLGTVPVPLTSPRFLAVDDDHLYVLDCDEERRLVTFDWDERELDAVDLPDLTGVVTGLFATDQGPCVEISHETVFLMPLAGAAVDGSIDQRRFDAQSQIDPVAASASPSRDSAVRRPGTPQAQVRSLPGRPTDRRLDRVTQVTFGPSRNVRIRSFGLDTSTLEPLQLAESSLSLASGLAIEHLLSVDGDGVGGLIVGARLLEPRVSHENEAWLVLTRLVPGGSGGARGGSNPASATGSGAEGVPDRLEATGGLFLTDSSFAYLGQPYVVAPDGRIIQPWASEVGYSILVHSLTQAEGAQ